MNPRCRRRDGWSGTGTITVSKNGTIKLVASLADGTATTVSSTLSSDYQVALFGQTFVTASQSKGQWECPTSVSIAPTGAVPAP